MLSSTTTTTTTISAFVVLLAVAYLSDGLPPVEACSSRAVPKPRPTTATSTTMPNTKRISLANTIFTTTTARTTTMMTTTTTTTPRPNITFPTYKCSEMYDTWYCLNEATCFAVKIGNSLMYNCECANGFMGPRCEYKELDGSYLPTRPRHMLEEASFFNQAALALVFLLCFCLTLYLRFDQNVKIGEGNDANVVDVDGLSIGRCRYCGPDNNGRYVSSKEEQQWWRRCSVEGQEQEMEVEAEAFTNKSCAKQ